MSIFLHDTLAGKKREFIPQDPERVTMYLCGPTVYNFAHIGNARPAVVFDVLARLLRSRYELVFARNITDVDDKINAASVETGKPIGEITERFVTAYNEDMGCLGVKAPDIEPHATDNIGDMIAMIVRLIAGGHAYEAEGHVLFDIESYDDYGALSRRDLRDMIAGARVEVAPYKRSPADFVLWKPSTDDLPGWDSPWGRGRPGWHLECSAMCLRHLAATIDIHCGGQDLVFPHHENEVAQSACANEGAPLARYWLHNGYLNVEQTKMSKSLGNVFLVRDLLKKHPGELLRLALLSAHYRQPLDWSESALNDARRMLDRLYGALRESGLQPEEAADASPSDGVIGALTDDINTPKALSEMFTLARAINRSDDPAQKREMAAELYASGRYLGLLEQGPEAWFAAGSEEGGLAADQIEALIEQRQAARESRDFGEADRIRDELDAAGILIEDGAGGTRWRRKS
ncbi:MAG: cysteine--tRNA ligase [Pseudomonadota bacterium]